MKQLEKYKEIIIHGVIDRLLNNEITLLEKLGVKDKLIYYVDNNPERVGTKTHTGYNIFDVNQINQNKEALIIICTLRHNEVIEQYKEMGINNDILLFPVFMIQGTENIVWDFEKAAEIILKYEDKYSELYNMEDIETRNTVEMYLKTAKANGYNRLYGVKEYNGTGGNTNDYFEESLFCLKDDITFVDVGAYTGDTLEAIYKRYGNRLKKYYAFEPDVTVLPLLEETVKKLGLTDIVSIYKCGLGKEKQQLSFSSNEGGMSGICSEGQITIQVVRLDDIELQCIGTMMIKMDIEGSEKAALIGARETIKKYKPYLAICMYHKPEDLYEIPKTIKDSYKDYELYIRAEYHTEVCAIPKDNITDFRKTVER